MTKRAIFKPEELKERLDVLLPEHKTSIQQIKQPNAGYLLEFLNKFMIKIGVDCDSHFRKINLDRELCGDIVPALAFCDMIKSLVPNIDQKLNDNLKPGTILNPPKNDIMFLMFISVNYLVFYSKCKEKLISNRYKYENLSLKNEELKEQQQNILTYRNNLAIKKTKGEIRRAEIEKERKDMKCQLKEWKEENEVLNNNYASLEYNLDILSRDMPTERKSKLDRQLKNIRTYIDLKSEENTLENEINSIRENIPLSTESLKVKKEWEIKYKNHLENELFSETNDHLIDIHKETENEEREIKKLNQELSTFSSDDKLNTNIHNVELNIKSLEKLHASFKTNIKVLQEELLKKKQEHVKFHADLESKIEEINSKNSTRKSKQKSIVNEQESLHELVRTLDEGCRKNYRIILEEQESFYAIVSKTIKDAKNQLMI